jgi:VWFA-related protein
MKEQGLAGRAVVVTSRVALASALVAALLWASPAAQQQPPPTEPAAPAPAADDQEAPEPQPTFRTGINFVSVDAIITDRQGNPVDDLTQDDFEVLEDGQPQTIETFKLIRVDGNPEPGEGTPRQITSTYAEEAEARRDDVRLFVIFFDDYHVRLGASMRVKQDMIQFIQTQIGPKDMIAMMYPLDPLRAVSFTRNHQAVIRAIERWEGRKYRYVPPRNIMEERYANYPVSVVERIRNQVSLSALRGLMTRLGGLREGRKTVIVVSEGYTDYVPPQINDPIASLSGLGNPNRNNPLLGDPSQGAEGALAQERQRFFGDMDIRQQMRDVYTEANRNNVSLYMLDPRGLAGFEFDIDQGIGLNMDKASLDATLDSLRLLADETDGRAIINRNDLDTGLKQMMQDSSAYYLLGYSSAAAPTDGRFHQIRVRVKRPNVEIRHRKGYWALRAEEAEAILAGPKEGPPPDVSTAMAEIERPTRARTIRSWVGYAPAEDGKTRVLFSWEPVAAGAGAVATNGSAVSQVTVMAANEADGPLYRGKVTSESGMAPAAAPAGGGQVSFVAGPGAAQMRLSAEDANGSVLDSDLLELTVPDFSQATEQVGTPALLRARTHRELQTVAANPDARPTAARAFSRTEKLLVRFASSGNAPVARLLNRDGNEMSPLDVREAPAGGAFTHEAEVPIASLPAGEFIVEVRASSAEDAARQLTGLRITS